MLPTRVLGLALLLAAAPGGAVAQMPLVDVTLTAAGPNRVAVIREVRELTSQDLRASRGLVENTPSALLSSVSVSKALEAVRRLAPMGSTVSIAPAAGPAPSSPLGDRPLLMPVEDVFGMTGMGTVVTGRILRGQISVGDPVELITRVGNRATIVTLIDRGREAVTTAGPGDNVGLVLRGIERGEVERGMAVVAPGSLRPRTAFRALFQPLASADPLPSFEGGDGRSGRLQVFIQTAEFAARWSLPNGLSRVPTGVPLELHIALDRAAPVEEGMEIHLRFGGATISTGVVSEIFF